MGLNGLKLCIVVALVACLLPAIYSKPRDSTVFVDQNAVLSNDDQSPAPEIGVKAENVVRAIRIPGRIQCQSMEAEEDPVCQEHCLPKGYTYGICVSQTCSCI